MPQITVIKGNKNWFSESFIEPDEIEIEETPSKHVIIEYKYPTEGEFEILSNVVDGGERILMD